MAVSEVGSPSALVRAHLIRSRNADGGWGYYPGKASRLEPTCWALLALGGETEGEVLQHWPVDGDLLLERSGGTANYAFHGLALLTLLQRRVEHAASNSALVAGLQRVKGVALPPSTNTRQRNDLQGWSWIGETFSWVEPTAWCLLALKKAERSGLAVDGARILEAEELLFDRCAAGGGWNYGNSNMLGQDLAPYVPTTALGLLALQDRQTVRPARASVEFLEREWTSERSATALGLTVLALRAWQRPAAAVVSALEGQLPVTRQVGNQHALSVACCALGTVHNVLAL